MKVKLLNENATAPTRCSEGAAGYDLYASEDCYVVGDQCNVIETGIAVEIPHGYVGIVKPRSGLAFKHGIDTMAGVIDSDYRGEVKLLLTSHDWNKERHHIKRGDSVAQLVILPCYQEPVEVVDELSDSERGENGFGSTDK